jgi:NAD(P)H-flavin reductase
MFPVNLSITHINKHTPLIWSFFMVPQNGSRPEFKAGQVAVLEMGSYENSYVAFASAPEDGEFEFLVKRSDSGSVRTALFDPHIAKHVAMKGIAGRGFSVEDHRGNDLVFIAMGTGLAPLRSALRHVFHSREEFGRLFVLYGARTAADFCFEEEMATHWREKEVELRRVISQPNGDWSGPTGYVQSLLDHLVPELNNPVALVCGSKEMMEQTRERLLGLGFAPEKVLTNY